MRNGLDEYLKCILLCFSYGIGSWSSHQFIEVEKLFDGSPLEIAPTKNGTSLKVP